jgi:hypothetical protein
MNVCKHDKTAQEADIQHEFVTAGNLGRIIHKLGHSCILKGALRVARLLREPCREVDTVHSETTGGILVNLVRMASTIHSSAFRIGDFNGFAMYTDHTLGHC